LKLSYGIIPQISSQKSGERYFQLKFETLLNQPKLILLLYQDRRDSSLQSFLGIQEIEFKNEKRYSESFSVIGIEFL
jgi:hypothetical protein